MRNFYILFVLVVLCHGALVSQVTTYTFSTLTGQSLRPMTGFTGLIGAGQDDLASAVTNIGFNFRYENAVYTQFSVNSNGLMRLGGTATSNDWTNDIDENNNNPKIMPLWDDLSTGTGGYVRYLLSGTAPNRILTIEYFLRHDATETSASNMTFQVSLFETSNDIEFVYGANTNNQASASIGIGGTANTNYLGRNHITNHTFATTGGVDNIATYPGNGRLYRFSPPAFRVSWSALNTGGDFCSGETRTVNVTVTNTGNTTWTSASGSNVNFSWWWNTQGQDSNPRLFPFTSLASGASQVVSFSITAPSTPGSYTLNLDLVAEGTCWFRNNSGGCGAGNISFTSSTIVVKELPSANAGAAISMICGNPVNLNGGGVGPVISQTLLSQNFESGLGAWITQNNTTGGTPANVAWTIRTSPHAAANNANSGSTNFIVSNSDAGGSGNNGTTILQSPSFSSVGYSTLNLTFRHYYRFNNTESVNVEVSTNGTLWTNLQTWTSTQGANNNFSTVSLNLNAYINNPVLFVRFRYVSSWDYYWCIDDISISGNSPAPITAYSWSPATNLSSTSIANPIASPTANQTYSLVVSSNGCQSLASDVNITVANIPAVPTVSVDDNDICTPQTLVFESEGMAPGGQFATMNNTATATVGGTAFSTNLSNHTIEFWVNPTRTVVLHPEITAGISGNLGAPSTEYNFAIAPDHGGPTNVGTGVSVGTNGIEVVQHGDAFFPVTLSYPTTISGWTHIAVVHAGNQPSLYINGSLVKTGVTCARPTFPGTTVGYVYGYFGGSIDNIRAWSVSRSQPQILASMNLEVPTVTTGLLNHLPLNGNGNALTGANATIGGATTFSNANYYTYTWSGGPALPTASTNESQTGGSITTSGTHNYIVNASLGSCVSSNSSTVSVTANTPSTAPTSITGTGTYCHGNAVTLTPSGGTLGSGASYEWFTGSCGGTAAGTGNSITVSPTATTQYFVRVAANGACPATTCANGTVTLPTAGAALGNNGENATCTVTENNWIHFYHSSGRLLASVNSGGQNLGNVTVTSYVDGANAIVPACDMPSVETAVMQRHWVITPQFQPTSNVLVRLPFGSAEVSSLSTAAGTTSNTADNSTGIPNIRLSRYHGPANVNASALDNCSANGGDENTVIHSPSANGATNAYSNVVGEHYNEYSIPEFSEFWLHWQTDNSPLPVNLTQSHLECTEKEVILDWTTASEQNADKFVIQRSRDINSWGTVGEVAASGNSSSSLSYTFVDQNAFGGDSYYRLVQYDFDGTATVYGPWNVACELKNTLNVYPNPTQGKFTISIYSEQDQQDAQIELMDVSGKIISSEKIQIQAGTSEVYKDLSELNAGTYLVVIRTENNVFSPVRIVKGQ